MKNKNMLKEFKQRERNFKCWHKKQKRWLSSSEYIITANGQVCEVIGREIFKNISKEVILVQSVGLLDKNGKEIYEEDVLEYALREFHKQRCIVEWVKSGFYVHQHIPLFEIVNREAEVIGNIFENPNLLKK